MAEQTQVAEKSFLRGLACAALSPGLRSVLLFDAGRVALRTSVLTLAYMLTITTHKPVKVVQLSSTDTEETLWGTFALAQGKSGPVASWHPGALVPDQGESAVRLILIPDLARLSLAARRGCVALMGSDVASLDRHGHHEEWHPDMCWVAACAISDMGKVTMHLRDRFTLRIDARHIERPSNTLDDLLSWVAATYTTEDAAKNVPPLIDWPGHHLPQSADTLIPIEIANKLREAASRPWPDIASDAIARVNEYMTGGELYSLRREIILARLAVANAQLEGVELVTALHVNMAARMLNQRLSLPLPTDQRGSPSIDPDDRSIPRNTDKASDSQAPVAEHAQVNKDPEGPDEVESFAPAPIAEDQVPDRRIAVDHEWESLRLPPGRERPVLASRGSITGVEPAKSLQDVAITATLFEAAKYQLIRRKNREVTDRRLLLSATDIHRYRRAPAETRLLVLVVDYTSLGNSQWERALLPHLRWAYQKRAAICLIQVGAFKEEMDGQEHYAELRAEKITERSILSPRFEEALYVSPGRATPLAHGLDLALQTLKLNVHQGEAQIEEARLIVLTDGRGNVPLSASREGRLAERVNREGIEDALMVARQISGLRHVHSLVLDPQPRSLAYLPDRLAAALGAELIRIPPQDVQSEGA